ncbi:hypothetical protein Tco_0608243 [Tanacetum coccineum]
MVAYLEKSEGNAEFHEIIDFLKRSYIHQLSTGYRYSIYGHLLKTVIGRLLIQNNQHCYTLLCQKSWQALSISEASIRSDASFDDAEWDKTPYRFRLYLCYIANGFQIKPRNLQALKAQNQQSSRTSLNLHKHHRAISEMEEVCKRRLISFKEILFLRMPEDTLIKWTQEWLRDEGKDQRNSKLKVLMNKLKVLKSTMRVLKKNEGTKEIFEGRYETIAKVLLNMSHAKAVSKEKEKGVELKDVEETERPRPTSTRSLLTLKPLPKIDPKDKGRRRVKKG